jgi:carbon dioxide concentrating mechanism protein CcmN
MSVPPLRLNNNFDSYISGEVTIHPSAVLAIGVILQAAANSKIIIGPGVCIGMGSILQVDEGTLKVEAGVSLGAGFLMVGQGTIGANACIGSATTVYKCSVEPGLVVPPGSILGDNSRRFEDTKQLEPSTSTQEEGKDDNGLGKGEGEVTSSTNLSVSAFLELKHQFISFSNSKSSPTPESQSSDVAKEGNGADSTIPEPAETIEINSQNSESNQPTTQSPNSIGSQIYGQGSINRLLGTLFPHRQSLNEPISDQKSE